MLPNSRGLPPPGTFGQPGKTAVSVALEIADPGERFSLKQNLPTSDLA
jgi:hypothetical protein